MSYIYQRLKMQFFDYAQSEGLQQEKVCLEIDFLSSIALRGGNLGFVWVWFSREPRGGSLIIPFYVVGCKALSSLKKRHLDYLMDG